MNILVIGSANTDMVIRTDKAPLIGETVMGREFSVNSGGKGLNQAVAISKLGGNVSFLGLVGDDQNGKMLTDTLKDYGVNFVGKALQDVPSGVALITVVGADNFIVLDEGANGRITPEFIVENKEIIEQADFIVLQLEIPVESIIKICEFAGSSKAKVVLNPAPYKKLPKELYTMVDYLIPNEHEAKDITGIIPDNNQSCIKAIKKLLELGVKNAIITLGDRGSVYGTETGIVFQNAEKAVAVDTTSAGDSFIGALTVRLAEGYTLPDAVSFATKVSAITVSRKGAAKSIPYINEVI